MIKFHSVGQIEHAKNYFVDAVTTADTFNGAFGDVAGGNFTVGATKTKAIMQVEVGDDEGIPKYEIPAGTHVRILDLAQLVGEYVEVYDYPLPETVNVADKLESDTDGSLKVNASAAGLYLEVKEFIGNKDGVLVLVQDAAE